MKLVFVFPIVPRRKVQHETCAVVWTHGHPLNVCIGTPCVTFLVYNGFLVIMYNGVLNSPLIRHEVSRVSI